MTQDDIYSEPKRRRYLTSPQTLKRYGDKSKMWLWRLLESDPNFPRPIYIRDQQYFDVDELDAYDADCRRTPSPERAAVAQSALVRKRETAATADASADEAA
jgi:hypothetical protein